jgi:DNA-binding MarR family transcriptional regulator
VAGKHGRSGAGITAQAERMDRDLGAIRRALRRPLEAEVARGELTVPQSAVMQAVVNHDGISLKDLSREVSLAHSTVSGIVDRLEKRGMIERRADAADGRVTRIHPTAIVRKFVREQIPTLSRGPLQAALERAKVEEREGLVAAIGRLRELLEEAAQ